MEKLKIMNHAISEDLYDFIHDALIEWPDKDECRTAIGKELHLRGYKLQPEGKLDGMLIHVNYDAHETIIYDRFDNIIGKY